LSTSSTVARRYAAALADVVVAQNEAREVQEELATWELMMTQNQELLEVFRNPTVPYDQKRRVLTTLIARTKARPTTANFLQVLLQNNRLVELPGVNSRFAQELDNRSGVVSAHVTTARTIPEDARQSLQSRLTDMTGRRVRLEFSEDEELIGGVVTRVGSTVFDGSVRGQLQQIKEQLKGV